MAHDSDIQWENPQPVHQPYGEEEYKHEKADIRKTTILLSVVTVVEVAIAVVYEKVLIDGSGWPRGPLMAFVAIMSAVKAFYIMKVFMHLGHERKGFQASILLPFLFLVWAIIAFSWEGNAWAMARSLLNSF